MVSHVMYKKKIALDLNRPLARVSYRYTNIAFRNNDNIFIDTTYHLLLLYMTSVSHTHINWPIQNKYSVLWNEQVPNSAIRYLYLCIYTMYDILLSLIEGLYCLYTCRQEFAFSLNICGYIRKLPRWPMIIYRCQC